MRTTCSVSVVVPCFNAEPWVGEALQSVLAQARQPLEVIVVDDCSTDDSAAVARRFAGVTVLTTGTNSGACVARNLGITTARGDLVAFLDADDIWEPHHLATVVPLLENHPEVCLAFSAMRRFGTRSGVGEVDAPVAKPFDAFWRVLSKVAHPPPSTTVVPLRVLQATGGFDPAMRTAEDYELWMRLARMGPFIYTDIVTAGYRCHPKQVTNRTTETLAGAYQARARLLEKVRRSEPDQVRQVHSEVKAVWLHEMFEAWVGGNRETGKRIWRLGAEMGLATGPRAHAWRALWAVFPVVAAAKRAVPVRLRRVAGRGIFGAGNWKAD